jgi:hypothetical protein
LVRAMRVARSPMEKPKLMLRTGRAWQLLHGRAWRSE